MGEKPSPSGEDFSRPLWPKTGLPRPSSKAGIVQSTLSRTRHFLQAAAKAGFIRLSEKDAEATAIQAVEPSLNIYSNDISAIIYVLLGFFRHKSTRSSTKAVPTHITVSAAPQ